MLKKQMMISLPARKNPPPPNTQRQETMKLNDLGAFPNVIFISKYSPDLTTDLSMWSLPAEPVLLSQTVELPEKANKIPCVMVEIFCQAFSGFWRNFSLVSPS